MKVVIACAESKAKNAGYMKTKTENGRCVKFVGNPVEINSKRSEFCYARPDDKAEVG